MSAEHICPRCAQVFARACSLRQHLGRKSPCAPAKSSAQSAAPGSENTPRSEDEQEEQPSVRSRVAPPHAEMLSPAATSEDGEPLFEWPKRGRVALENAECTLHGYPFSVLVEVYERALHDNPARAKTAVLVHLTGAENGGEGAKWSLAPVAEAALFLSNGTADAVQRLPESPEDVAELPRGAVKYLAESFCGRPPR